MRGTVAAHATGNVPVAHIGQSVDEVLTVLRGHAFDSVVLVPVCTNELLLGVVTVERLLGAAPGASVEEVMDTQPPTVTLGTDQEHAAWQAVQHDEAALAVVDEAGRSSGRPPRVAEAVTGLLLGVLFAAVSYPAVALVWRDADVAAAVAVALFAASSLATLIAMLLPWTLHRLGRDPAFGSGPLATVAQDLLSIVIYFLAATALVA